MIKSIIRKLRKIAPYSLLEIQRRSRYISRSNVNGLEILLDITSKRELSRAFSYSIKEPETLQWIDEYFRPGDVFFDIGANIGQYSLYSAKRFEGKIKVYSFEPESQNFSALNRNIVINNLSDSVKAFCLAVSSVNGIKDFYIHNELMAGSALHQFGDAKDHLGDYFESSHSQGMVGMTLDQLCYSEKLPFPNFIKIDVDGHERDILEGADNVFSDPRLKSILIEINEISISEISDTEYIRASLEKHGLFQVNNSENPAEIASFPSNNVVFLRRVN